jgi:UDP-N-acetylmuramate--alanine ligase
VVRRAEALAALMSGRRAVCVAGTHGKTSTTSMLTVALQHAGLDPSFAIGGELNESGTGAHAGSGDVFVAEADESDGSFLHLPPLVAVVTNVDDDHMDHYGTMTALKDAFVAHLARLPFYGAAVLCADDPALKALRPRVTRPVVTYGFSPGADWRARSTRLSKDGSVCEVLYKGRKALTLRLRVPGRHNVSNALAALAAGRFLGFDPKRLARGLAEFRGVGRRLDRLGAAGGVEFVDDYGHHPTEIRATLGAVAGLWKAKRVVVIFQPHRYSRTKLLAKEFGPALRGAGLVYVTPVYAAGEKPVRGVGPEQIVESARRAGVNAQVFPGPLEAAKQLKAGDVVLTLGAGDVWKIGEDLLRRRRGHSAAAL